jgi:biopolymer transport protein ExbD
MQFEGRRRLSHVPNLTPLIDIVFLLLVFFMLTSHFVQEAVLEIELPVADGQAQLQSAPIEVVLDSQGRILLQEHYVSVSELKPRLQQLLAQQQDKVVRIRGDQSVSLGLTVSVMEAVQQAGAQGVDIVTQQK